jgi:outer membrane lipoprotein carrier protein
LVFILTLSVLAQDNGKDLLDSVQKEYKSINNFIADFKELLNGKDGITGNIYYSKGNKFRLELKNSTIISDGTTLWNYNKRQKKVVINNTSSSDPSSFTIENFLFDYPSKSDVTLEKENNRKVLVLIPQEEKKMNFKKAKIWVDPDYLITKVSIENLSGTITNFQLSNYKLNQNLPDSRYTFSPPEGTNVIDLRK